MAQHHVGPVIIAERGNGAGLPGRRHVERAPDAIERIDDMWRAIGPADTLCRQPVQLGKGAQRHDIGKFAGQVEAIDIIALGEFGIGAIYREQAVGGQPGVQAADFGARNLRAGRVVGVGEIDQPGARCDRGQHGIDIAGIIIVGRYHRRRADPAGGEFINDEAVPGVEHLVADAGKGPGEQVEQFIRTGAADDAIGVQPVFFGQRRA